jgi:cell wall-associated NlpC family hydrolase
VIYSTTTSYQSGKTSRRVLSGALAVLIAASLLIPFNIQRAYAEPTSAQKQAEADEVATKLNAYEAEMVQIGEDYRNAVQAHDTATSAMDEAQQRIDAAQAIIADTQEKLGVRATSMYRNGPLSFLDVLFGASSFEQFTTNWDILSNINNQNATLIQANKDARAEAKDAYAEFSTQEQLAAERLAESTAIKVRAEENIAAQQAELAGLEAEVADLVAAEQEAQRVRDAEKAAAAAAKAKKESSNAVEAGNSSGSDSTPEAPTPPPSKPVPSEGYSSVVEAAASRIGCPYVSYPGPRSGPDSFDCSGLTSWCYAQAGLGYIGSSDSSQYASASARWAYSDGDAAPGDVLWWPGHVAIYAGNGSYIHAPQSGEYVCYSSWNIGSSTVLRF